MHTVIIGGTRGIGREAVQRMTQKGNHISSVGQHDKGDTKESANPNVKIFYGDLTDPEKREQIFDEIINIYGPINNLLFFQRFRGETDSWQNEIETSLTVTKSVIESLTDRFSKTEENSIILVSSVAAEFIAQEQEVGYHVVKAGMLQLVKYYAVVLGKKKIRVNCVSPAIVLKQEAQEYYQQHQRKKDLFGAITPLGRMGTSEDVINLIEFLCSDKAAYITGQNIIIDGGLTLQMQASLCMEQFLKMGMDEDNK